MPTKSEAFPSPYYNAGDVKDRPVLLTIQSVQIEVMPSDGKEKYCASFHERDAKKLVITPTKWDDIAFIAGSDNCDDWSNTKIVLFGSTARYAGKTVPSIGIRAPKNNPIPAQASAQTPAVKPRPSSVDMMDDIPF